MENKPTYDSGNETSDENVAQMMYSFSAERSLKRQTPSLDECSRPFSISRRQPFQPHVGGQAAGRGRGPHVALYFLYWFMKP